MIPEISKKINSLQIDDIPKNRKKVLQPLIAYLKEKRRKKEIANLNFICTHNSRRSQFSQVWAATLAHEYNLEIECFSGGTETTAFHKNALTALENSGFKIQQKNELLKGSSNPIYQIWFDTSVQPVIGFSKLFNSDENPNKDFAAVMTCSHADENCPLIPGAEIRISLDYEDPKLFDGTSLEAEKYMERSDQIALEFKYVFDQIKKGE